jgi:hypothetical protein
MALRDRLLLQPRDFFQESPVEAVGGLGALSVKGIVA